MRLSILGACAAALAFAACGQQDPEHDAGRPAAAAPPADLAAPGTLVSVAAPEYVTATAAMDMYQLEAGRLAEQRAQNEEVRVFAKMMLAEHGQAMEDLKTAISQARQALVLPRALPADRQTQVNALEGASAEEFDTTFLNQQVQAHEAALGLQQSYAQAGDVPSLRAYASAAAPVLQRHLEQARQLRERLVVQASPAPTPEAPADGAAPPAAGPTIPGTPPPTSPGQQAPPTQTPPAQPPAPAPKS